MPLPMRARRSTLTAFANISFGLGVLLLFVAMYNPGSSFRGALLVLAGVLLVGAIAGWIAAARWGRIGDDGGRNGG
jgi:hypothetical protein